jgi:hypothetical protein
MLEDKDYKYLDEENEEIHTIEQMLKRPPEARIATFDDKKVLHGSKPRKDMFKNMQESKKFVRTDTDYVPNMHLKPRVAIKKVGTKRQPKMPDSLEDIGQGFNDKEMYKTLQKVGMAIAVGGVALLIYNKFQRNAVVSEIVKETVLH